MVSSKKLLSDQIRFSCSPQSLGYYDKLVDAYETKYSPDRKSGIQRLTNLCKKSAHLI